MYPIEQPVKSIIREALLNHKHRDESLSEIALELNITYGVAKQLYFAFLYYAEESYLCDILLREQNS